VQQLFSGVRQCILQQHRDLRDRINGASSTSIYRRKTTLFVEGQTPRGVFILCTGRAKLSTSSTSGKTIITRIAHAGDVLGLNAVVAGRPYSVTAEMTDSGQVAFISRDAFLRIMKEHGQIGVAVAEQLSLSYYPAHETLRTLGLGTHPHNDWPNFSSLGPMVWLQSFRRSTLSRSACPSRIRRLPTVLVLHGRPSADFLATCEINGSLNPKGLHWQSQIAWN
jgi:Cyclic nucleotide-binding domain